MQRKGTRRRITFSAPANLAKWTDEDVKTLREMWADGASDKDIADALDRTINSVIMKRHYLCLLMSREAKAENQRAKQAQHSTNKPRFCITMIRDATVEYYPKWYIEELKRRYENGELILNKRS